jgi:NAD(P)-dependent dehydrogenase (short-subunit alcohol dehydrogenase family)
MATEDEPRKVALITGSESGIGRATAIKLAKRGYDLALLGIDEDALSRLCVDLRKQYGVSVIELIADVSEREAVAEAMTNLTNYYGRLDVLIVNAGINGTWAPIDDLSEDEWDKTISVNLKGCYLSLHHAVPHLKKTGGAIVIVSSINGTRTFTSPGATAYSASKAAQVAIAQQLALELASYSIRVNVICPGEIETNIGKSTEIRHPEETAIPAVWPDGQVPITGGKPGSSEDVAKLITFLVSDDAKHITGTPIWIDGGQGLLR